ncbi:hypothetical protein V5F44_11195 [Xanthobacter sp. V2C-8]|uniref:hypothetical protein n=1 Tax=Xanthobacter albus TaxID=3119929 RepID=UPI00372A4C01
MRRFAYRFTPLGWVGAALLVLPAPLTGFLLAPRAAPSAGQQSYDAALSRVTGGESVAAAAMVDLAHAMTISTISGAVMLAGLVLVLIGRELIEVDGRAQPQLDHVPPPGRRTR